jgi:hypothetical protein
MLEIVTLIAIWIGTFVVSLIQEDPLKRAILYATLIAISVSGIFILSNILLNWSLAILWLIMIGVMILKGEEILEATLKAAIISRILIALAMALIVILPIAATILIAHLFEYWFVYVLLASPGILIIIWLEWLLWGPTIKVYYQHYIKA